MIAVDLHAHTCYSPDSRTSPADIASACRRAGIDCIAVTDHDSIEGAVAVRDVGGIRVIVGEEIRTNAGELIGLFLVQRVPPGLSPLDTIDRVRAQGGLVCLPHPFSRWPLARLKALGYAGAEALVHGPGLPRVNRLLGPEVLEAIDMIEVINSRTPFAGNWAAARELADACGLPGTAGSDAHLLCEVGRARIEMPDFSDAAGFLASLRDGHVSGVRSSALLHLASMYARLRKRLC